MLMFLPLVIFFIELRGPPLLCGPAAIHAAGAVGDAIAAADARGHVIVGLVPCRLRFIMNDALTGFCPASATSATRSGPRFSACLAPKAATGISQYVFLTVQLTMPS
jgi:hypothetical protein